MTEMGVLDRFRGGDEEEGMGRLPVEEVRSLGDQGYSDDEISEALRDRGYSYGEINEAMNQAVRDRTVEREESGGGPRDPVRGPAVEDDDLWEGEEVPRDDTDIEEFQSEPEPEPEPAGEGGGGFGQPSGVSVEEEELIETIVAEYFTDVEDEFENVYHEIDALAGAVEELQDRVEEIEIRDDEDQQEVVQKVDEMEDYLQQSQSRIGGMEKAFQQVLPSLVENVRELSTLVKDMKEEE